MEHGAELIVNLSASPFSLGKLNVRRQMIGALARTFRVPICYCNAVGGNDQLVFDGNSFAVNRDGELIAQLTGFAEAEAIVETESTAAIEVTPRAWQADLLDTLTLGLSD